MWGAAFIVNLCVTNTSLLACQCINFPETMDSTMYQIHNKITKPFSLPKYRRRKGGVIA